MAEKKATVPFSGTKEQEEALYGTETLLARAEQKKMKKGR